MGEVVLLTLLIALPLTLALSALISWRYRSTVRKLMRLAPSPTDSDSPGVVQSELGAIAIGPTDPEVRPSAPLPARERQLNLSLALCSVLIGTTGAWLYLLVHQQEFGGITPLRLLLVSLVWCSPGVVLQALVLRWPLSRQMPVLLGWGSALVLLLAATSSGGFSVASLSFVFVHILLPLLVLGLLFGVPVLRAIAPYLFPVVASLCLAVIAAFNALAALVEQGSAWIGVVLPASGAVGLILLVMVAAFVATCFPAHGLAKVLGKLYRRQAFSDLSYLFGTCWLLVLTLELIPGISASNAGLASLMPLLAWLWIPLLFQWLPQQMPPPHSCRPPRLLVLRVFRRGGPMAWLFDHVVQRWRLIGPVLLITAADLASRTIEPNELVAFVEGRLQNRYISTNAQLRTQVEQIKDQPDHDGRWRVHEFCCYANTWKQSLDALLSRSDVVLMDLRGFSSRNAGCRHELNRIGQSKHLGAAVLLIDRHTDQTAAQEALGSNPAASITWQPAEQRRISANAAVLEPLLKPFFSPSRTL